jgi:hypothetical protein
MVPAAEHTTMAERAVYTAKCSLARPCSSCR